MVAASAPPTPVTLPPLVEGPARPPPPPSSSLSGAADTDTAADADVPAAIRELPVNYHERYRLNFALHTAPLPPAWTVTPAWEAQAREFRTGLHLYEDFLQRKRFAQLRKTILVRWFA